MAQRHVTRRQLLEGAGALGATALAGCGGKGGVAAESGACGDETDEGDELVVVRTDEEPHFDPQTVEVSVGDTVVWQAAEGTEDHQIRAVETPAEANWYGISTRFLENCQTYSHTFEVAGTFTYQCSPYHPGNQGTIEVTE